MHLIRTPRHIAGRALLAAIRGTLWYHRLSTPVLEQLRHCALEAAHGRKDTDPTLLAALRALRETDETLTRRARMDAADAAALQAIPERTPRTTAGPQGGTRVPLPPPPPRPLAPQALRAEHQVLQLESDAL